MKPDSVKIVSIAPYMIPTDTDHIVRFYGLGDDEKVYLYDSFRKVWYGVWSNA